MATLVGLVMVYTVNHFASFRFLAQENFEIILLSDLDQDSLIQFNVILLIGVKYCVKLYFIIIEKRRRFEGLA
jgi:hypothetical protein